MEGLTGLLRQQRQQWRWGGSGSGTSGGRPEQRSWQGNTSGSPNGDGWSRRLADLQHITVTSQV